VGRIAAPRYSSIPRENYRIVETKFVIGELTYTISDVCGQRSKRKKWMNGIDNVDAIVFFMACSEYDLFLFERDSMVYWQ
jgi:translation elongation factor EF-1alpha